SVATTRHRDTALRPLAGILHQVAEHLLEVLLLAAKEMVGGDVDRELQIAPDVQAGERALDGRDGGGHRHARARHVDRRGRARPRPMVSDLLTRRGDLASHRSRQLGGAGRGGGAAGRRVGWRGAVGGGAVSRRGAGGGGGWWVAWGGFGGWGGGSARSQGWWEGGGRLGAPSPEATGDLSVADGCGLG